MDISIAKCSASTIASQLLTRVLDSVKRDKVLQRDYELQVSILKSNIATIEKYRDAVVLGYEPVSEWYTTLKDVMYAAIDALDVYATSVEKNSMDKLDDKLKRILYTATIHWAGGENSLRLARTIQLINEKIDTLHAEGKKHGYLDWIEAQVNEYPKQRALPTSRSFDDYPILGRDNVINDIISRLSVDMQRESGAKLRVLPIVGMGGIGKTTVAQHVYASEKGRFDLCGWVHYFNEKIDVEELLKKICRQFRVQVSDQLIDYELLNTSLAEALKDKRFLLVVDDVWSKEKHRWEELLSPLKSGKEGSKLIITTRDKKVVETIICGGGTVESTVELPGLPEDDMWLIFVHHAFGYDKLKVPEYAERIGKDIVKKLKGLPLAAKAIGRVIKTDLREQHWESICNSNLWGKLESQKDVNLVPALILSFLLLPTPAKACFSYCSLFPKGERIDERELMYQWLAHDYLQVKDDESVEDAGVDMLNLFDFERGRIGEVFKSFPGITEKEYIRPFIEMHDLVHDSAQASGKDDHLQMVADEKLEKLQTLQKGKDRFRHVLINMENISRDPAGNKRKLEMLKDCTKLRTLMLLGRRRNVWGSHLVADSVLEYIQQLNCLRVLTLSGLKIENSKLLENIGKLKHLRYLDMSDTSIGELPDTLAKLYHLGVLLLRRCSELWSAPNKMKILGRLQRLRYLDLSNNGMNTLPRGLTMLSDLRVLRLSDCRFLKKLPDGIDNLKLLEHLDLYRSTRINKVPIIISLKELDIRGCRTEKDILDLEKCKNLRHLYMDKCQAAMMHNIGSLTLLENLKVFAVDERIGNPVKALQKMNMLSGSLIICGLDNVYKSSEAKSGMLEDKINLRLLELSWEGGRYECSVHEDVLEFLKPNDRLEELVIDSYMGKKPPGWLCGQYLRFLKHLRLTNCKGLGNFIIDNNSRHLVDGYADWIFTHALKLVEPIRQRNSGDPAEIFPFLESLKVKCAPELSEWTGLEVSGNNEEASNSRSVRLFPRLREVTIEKCDKLSYMPDLPLSLKNIKLDHVGLRQLPQLKCHSKDSPASYLLQSSSTRYIQQSVLFSVQISHCPSLLSLDVGFLNSPLPYLRELRIQYCENLEIPPRKGFSTCLSLEVLIINKCPKLTKLSLEDDPLPNHLQHLEICDCGKLETESIEKFLKSPFASLRRLKLENLLKELGQNWFPSSV